MKLFWHNTKVVFSTIAFMLIVMSIAGITYAHKNNLNVEVKADEVITLTLPDFEHTSNQQFLDNVNQCVDYIYHTTTDVFPINRELL